jgi:hypothetical protein
VFEFFAVYKCVNKIKSLIHYLYLSSLRTGSPVAAICILIATIITQARAHEELSVSYILHYVRTSPHGRSFDLLFICLRYLFFAF